MFCETLGAIIEETLDLDGTVIERMAVLREKRHKVAVMAGEKARLVGVAQEGLKRRCSQRGR